MPPVELVRAAKLRIIARRPAIRAQSSVGFFSVHSTDVLSTGASAMRAADTRSVWRLRGASIW
jgi:hypothetical protein